MKNISPIVPLAAATSVYLALDTMIILRTGKTPGLFYKHLRYRQRYGPITRKGRPRHFWAYAIGKRDHIAAVHRLFDLGSIFEDLNA